MADRIKTVKSAGGDYSSLSGWVAGEAANITAGGTNENRLAECYSFQDTTAVTFAGFTTDATHYIKIYTPTTERHPGYWSTSKYYLSISRTGANTDAVTFNVDFGYFIGIQVETNGTDANQHNTFAVSTVGAGSKIWIQKCLFRQAAASAGTGIVSGFVQNNANSTVYISNCYFFDYQQGATSTAPRAVDTQGNNTGLYLDNCGAYNCSVGFRRGSTSTVVAVVRNSWAQACTNNGFLKGGGNAWNAASDYNISNLASDAPGTHSKQATITFVATASKNYHLDPSDTVAKGYAADLSADANDPFADDIDGDARAAGQWDNGPDQITGVGGGGGGGSTNKGFRSLLGVGV